MQRCLETSKYTYTKKLIFLHLSYELHSPPLQGTRSSSIAKHGPAVRDSERKTRYRSDSEEQKEKKVSSSLISALMILQIYGDKAYRFHEEKVRELDVHRQCVVQLTRGNVDLK